MERPREWLRSNQGVGFVFTLVLIAFLIYLELRPWVHREVRDGFTLGFFPLLAVVLLLVFSLMLMVDGHRKETAEDLEAFALKPFLGGVVIVGATWLYFAVMRTVGFLIMTPFYLLFFIYFLGLRLWLTCAVSAVVMTVVVYVAFTAIGIRLPPGILEGILPF
jgi:putative tricarboxylic transport membrane protein